MLILFLTLSHQIYSHANLHLSQAIKFIWHIPNVFCRKRGPPNESNAALSKLAKADLEILHKCYYLIMEIHNNSQLSNAQRYLPNTTNRPIKYIVATFIALLPVFGSWIGYYYGVHQTTLTFEAAESNEKDTKSLDCTHSRNTEDSTQNTVQNILVCIPAGTPCQYYHGTTIMAGSYPDSFEKINDVYYKDAQQVFAMWYTSSDYAYGPSAFVVEDADPASFEPIYSEAFRGGIRLAKDHNHVYLNNKALRDVDPNSLRLFSFSNRLIADDFGVYLDGDVVDYLDSPTFTIGSITEQNGSLLVFASDKNGNYQIIISGADDHSVKIERL